MINAIKIISVLFVFLLVGCSSSEPKRVNRTQYPGSPQMQQAPRQSAPRQAAQQPKRRTRPSQQTRQQQESQPTQQRQRTTRQAQEAPQQPRASQERRQQRPRPRPQSATAGMVGAVIGVDGVAVFEGANFDSAVVGYLERGQKVNASAKPEQGAGGFGMFHKIQVNGKDAGYVTDVDLVLNQTELPEEPTQGPFAAGPFLDDDEYRSQPTGGSGGKIGGYLGFFNYSETVLKRARRSNHLFYGAKILGANLPVDANVLLSFSPPSYYDSLTSSAPSGFILFTDVLLTNSFIEWPGGNVKYGFGLMALYSKYTLTIEGAPIDSQELRMGAVLGLSTSLNISPRISLQGDVRYYLETNNYLGLGLAVLTTY